MADFTLDDCAYNEILRLYWVYHGEAEKCRNSKAFLAGCVMIGACLEAILIAVADCLPEEVAASPKAPRKAGGIKPLLEWSLSELLAVAKDRDWLPSALSLADDWDAAAAKIGDYAEVVRQIRNLVHPARYATDLPRERVTRRYLEGSLEVMSVAADYLVSKVLGALSLPEEGDEVDGGA